MIAEISAGFTSLKAAKDLLQALHGVQTAVAINDVKFALQSHLLDAQQGLFAAQEAQSAASKRISDLEEEIVRIRDWKAERENYELVDVWHGAFAYMPKGGVESGEIAHWLCTNCFEQGRKSLMQNKGGVTDALFGCDGCQATFRVASRIRPSYPDEI